MGVPEVPASLRSWMSAVSEIVRSVNAAEPLEMVVTRVAVQACELIGFEFCAVMLADERRECLHIAGCSGLTPDYLAQVSEGRSLRIHPPGPDLDTFAARAYREDRTIVVPDVRKAPRLRQAAPPRADAGLPGPAGLAAARFRRPGRGHRRLLGHRTAVDGRAGTHRTARRPGRGGPRDGAAAGRAAGGHPGAVPGQRRAAPGASRAGVGRAAAPSADATRAGRGRAPGTGQRTRVGAARIGHGGGHRRPRAGERSRRGLLPAPRPGHAAGPRGARRAEGPGGVRPPLHGGQGAGAGSERPGRGGPGRVAGRGTRPPGPPLSWWAANWPGACG